MLKVKVGQWKEHTLRLVAKHDADKKQAEKEAAVLALEKAKERVRAIEPKGFDRCSHLSTVLAILVELQLEINHG